ncbi:NAD kinase 2, mitochondrial isoform X1 [Cimex lectularius]|uniref:NAD(+) kinase n=1 Tax=Cimex lectularius TaxID=79782 RepID=A0A8I6SDY5_CIMLE|nr:NAD kinase 2, mitochondrial isoform X1 [Cimex lectularius]
MISNISKRCCSHTAVSTIKRVLVVKKRSRYSLEKGQYPGITDAQLDKILKKRGSDVEMLLLTHKTHTCNTQDLLNSFISAGFHVDVVDRTKLEEDAIEWADLVVAAGGDGTFLMSSSKIKTRDKSIVGFNTDPCRSTGYLCVNGRKGLNCSAIISRIKKEDYNYLFRTRIQVKLTGLRANEDAVELDQCPQPIFYRSPGSREWKANENSKVETRVLPFLALNEVFIGESLSSQVSHLVLDVPGVERTKVKCSGLCVSTGTGSTSWHMSINRLTKAKVHKLLEIAGIDKTPQEIEKISNDFNASLRFSPDDPRLFYTLRDLIRAGVWPDPPGLPSGAFTPSLVVTSKCFSANLVLDGSKAYAFNDGTVAEMESRPENMLRTLFFP